MAANLEAQAEKLIPGDIYMISGCADSQTSADVSNMLSFQLPSDVGVGGAGGACSGALTSVLTTQNPANVTWSSLLNDMRTILVQKRFTQVPQLSSSRKISLECQFQIVPPGYRPRRAVYIGINYVGMQGELRGCQNDAKMMRNLVTQRLGMGGAETRLLMDDNASLSPTRKNLIDSFKWLIEGAKSGDALFLHYSGHGGYEKDDDGDEADARDETVVPIDYRTNGQIRDDEIYQLLVLPLPKGVRLTVVMDCCHSGSIFDLPFMFQQTNATDANAPPPVMTENPDFNWKKVLALGLKLFQMHQGGASFDQIRLAALNELQNDPAMKQGLILAATSAARMIGQLSGSNLNASEGARSAKGKESSNNTMQGVTKLAKLGANILMAANEAGSAPNPTAGFSKFLSKASKFF